MTRTSFLVGISAIALAAGANAQTTTTNGDTTDANTGNRVVVSCTTGSGNTCSVTQGAGTTFSSSGSANAAGSNNTSTVNQTGNRQYAENRATGNRNSAAVTQGGFNNSSSISQTGSITSTTAGAFANSATVNQGSQANGNGNNNIAQIVQVRTAGAADSLGSNSATVTQGTVSGGFNNTGITTQNGTALTSTITQTDQGNGVRATNNSATVSQTNSLGASSTVTQSASGNVASVSMFGGNNTTNTATPAVTGANISSVTQGNTLFGTSTTAGAFTNTPTASGAVGPNTGNSVSVAIAGLQNNSTVSQNGVQNSVDQSMLNGGAGNTNAANASGTNPGVGGGFPANRPEGNSSTINQSGRGNYAATSIGGRVTTGGGSGNISSITQSTLTGSGGTTATAADAGVTQTTLTSTQTANSGHRALVYQRGILDQVSISQSSNAFGGNSTGAAGTVQAGSLADVATLSFNSSTSVTQVGTNTGRVTQGSRTETTGANNSATINQTDLGDITSTTTTPGTGGGFGGTGGTSSTTTGGIRNFGEIVQYGIENNGIVQQRAINASATVFQAVGTRNNIAGVYQQSNISFGGSQSTQQATASADPANANSNVQNVTASVSQTAGQGGLAQVIQAGRNLNAVVSQQGGTASPAGAAIVAANNSNNAIRVSQAFDYNSATVSQNGTGLNASVEQRGTGSATLLNLVTITQSGGGTAAGAGNTALARQTQNAGFSGASGATAGVPNDVNFPFSRSGANSAEIVILQSGTGGSATVEQRGKGQYASITQTGTRNTGGILQDTAATNAVAVLTQSGTDNTYYITQTTAGQYIRVSQSGTDNTASIINGPSGAGNSNATPTVAPPAGTFGGVQ